MGLTASGRTVSGQPHQLWRFNDVLTPRQVARDGIDRLYVPQQSWVTGDIDPHDLAIDSEGRPIVSVRPSPLADYRAGAVSYVGVSRSRRFQGSSSSMRLMRWSAMWVSTWRRYASGSMPLSLQVPISE